MHISPVNPWLGSFEYCLLRLINCIVNIFLLICKFAINRESNSLISTITIPFSTHVMENHLAGLYYFIILYVMEGSTVSSTRANRLECKIFTSAMYSMLKIKESMHLDLGKSRLTWFHYFDMRVCCYFAYVPH